MAEDRQAYRKYDVSALLAGLQKVDTTEFPVEQRGHELYDVEASRRMFAAIENEEDLRIVRARVLLYFPNGVFVPDHKNIHVSARVGAPMVFDVTPTDIVYGRVSDITPEVNTELGFTNLENLLHAHHHHKIVRPGGFYTLLLGNTFQRVQ